jgi:hypothetical protein
MMEMRIDKLFVILFQLAFNVQVISVIGTVLIWISLQINQSTIDDSNP